MKITFTLLFLLTFQSHASSIHDSFYELDNKFYTLEVITAECAFGIKQMKSKPQSEEKCKKLYALKDDEIDKLKSSFNRELNRYNYRKDKLSKHDNYWTKQYINKIHSRARNLQKNIKDIYSIK